MKKFNDTKITTSYTNTHYVQRHTCGGWGFLVQTFPQDKNKQGAYLINTIY